MDFNVCVVCMHVSPQAYVVQSMPLPRTAILNGTG